MKMYSNIISLILELFTNPLWDLYSTEMHITNFKSNGQ